MLNNISALGKAAGIGLMTGMASALIMEPLTEKAKKQFKDKHFTSNKLQHRALKKENPDYNKAYNKIKHRTGPIYLLATPIASYLLSLRFYSSIKPTLLMNGCIFVVSCVPSWIGILTTLIFKQK